MFGLSDQYSETAGATVLGAKRLMTGKHAKPKYEFLLEVKPIQGKAFIATTLQHLPLMARIPQEGESVSVRYNPRNYKIQLEF